MLKNRTRRIKETFFASILKFTEILICSTVHSGVGEFCKNSLAQIVINVATVGKNKSKMPNLLDFRPLKGLKSHLTWQPSAEKLAYNIKTKKL